MRNLCYKLLLYIAVVFIATGCDKGKDDLRVELRLLHAGIETGMNSTEFSQRIIRVRAAHQAVEKRLSQREKAAYAGLDSEVTACLFFWKEYTSGTFKSYSSEAEQVAQMFGLRPQRAIKYGEVYYYPQHSLRQMLSRVSQSVESFLNGNVLLVESTASMLHGIDDGAVAEARKQAIRGDAEAQFNLGLDFERGVVFERDGVEAFKWFSMAARKGYVAAELKFGLTGC